MSQQYHNQKHQTPKPQQLYYYNLSNDVYDIAKGYVNPYGSILSDEPKIATTRSRPSSGRSVASHGSNNSRVVYNSNNESSNRSPRGLGGLSGVAPRKKDAWEDFSSNASSSSPSSPQIKKRNLYSDNHANSLLDAPFSIDPSSRPGSARHNLNASLSSVSKSSSSGTRKKMGISADRTRPMFLIDLARYIKDELRLLGAESAHPGDERRLQVFREAFSQFIEEFKTYEPLLSEIKREYEMAIEGRDRSLQEMEPIKGKLSVLTFQAAQEMDKVRADALVAMGDVSRENEELSQRISSLQKDLVDRRNAYNRLLEEFRQKEAEYRKEPPEAEMLRQLQVEYTMLEKMSEERDGRHMERAQRLEQSLEGVKKELSIALSALEVEQIRSAKSIDPSIHSALQGQYEEAQKQIHSLKEQTLENEKTIEGLRKENKALLQRLKQKDEEMFPDWEHIQFSFSESIKEFWEMAKGKSYNDAIGIFIREIIKSRLNGGNFKGNAPGSLTEQGQETNGASKVESILVPGLVQEPSFFVGLGTGLDVPKHLRIKGKIPNRRISKKDLLLLIKDTWEAKAIFDSDPKRTKKQSKPSSLAEFLYTYLKKRFGAQSIIAEWGYNIEEACKKYALQSAECSLFYDILKGDVYEEVYLRMEATLKRLKNAFHRLDTNLHEGKAKGFVPKSDLIQILQSFWPNKPKQQFNAMLSALEADQPGNMISYRWLFDPDGESSFLEVIREQENEARQSYARDLEGLFKTASKEVKIACVDVQKILSTYDPQKNRAHLDMYLSRGFDLPLDSLKPKTMIDKQLFVQNLKRGPLLRGPSEGLESDP